MSNEGGKTQPEDEVPRANPQHVVWLNEGVESWNRRRKEEPFSPVLTRVVFDDGVWSGLDPLLAERYSPLRSKDDFSDVNLSDTDLRGSILSEGVFRHANLTGADLTGAHAFRTDFSGANFSGAKLWKFHAKHAKFNGAEFWDSASRQRSGSRLTPKVADFACCELPHTDFRGSDLDGVELLDCNLRGARLDKVSMAGTSFAGSALWRARLFGCARSETGFKSVAALGINEVKSIRDLVKLRRKLFKAYAKDADLGRVRFYFRGEPCAGLALRPTVTRGSYDSLRLFEPDLLTELKTESPATFSGCEFAIDELAVARHFGLPSRLLDVTRNPLVGAFWATDRSEKRETQPWECEFDGTDDQPECPCTDPNGMCDGRLHVFAFPRKNVCAYDSDRVSIVANFARLPLIQQEYLLTKNPDDVDFGDLSGYERVVDWPRGEPRTKLLHNIQREKPYFVDRIDARDLFRVFVVEPRRSFDRIRAQSGAFMLSAFHERFEGDEVAKSSADTKLYDHHVLTIPAGKKYELREELDWFGINAQTLFADVETTADAVANRFRELAKRRDDPPDGDDSDWMGDEYIDERGG